MSGPVCDSENSMSTREIHRSLTTECPVCMKNNEIIYPSCNHAICKTCVGYICSDLFKYQKRCPICRESYNNTECVEYASYCKDYDNNIAGEIDKQIQNLISRDPIWTVPIAIVSRNLPMDEVHSQVSAINAMFDGKISYAEMRMLAG